MMDWIIRHPGGMGQIECDTLDEAMKWFEGFNPPRKRINGKIEAFDVSLARIRSQAAGKRRG